MSAALLSVPLNPWAVPSWFSKATEDVSQPHCLSPATQSCELSQLLSPKVPPTSSLQGSYIKSMQPEANRCFAIPSAHYEIEILIFFRCLYHPYQRFSGIKADFTEHLLSPLLPCESFCKGLVMPFSCRCCLRMQS